MEAYELNNATVIRVQPGDTIIVRTPYAPDEEMLWIKNSFKDLFPEGVGVIVVGPGVEITAVSEKVEIAS